MEKLIIYKDFGGYKVTSETNYNAYVRNEFLVMDMHVFESAQEIVAYLGTYAGCCKDDFIIFAD